MASQVSVEKPAVSLMGLAFFVLLFIYIHIHIFVLNIWWIDHNMMRARFIYLLLFSGVLNSFCTWRNSSLSKLGKKMLSMLLKRNSLPSFITMTVTFNLVMVF